MMLAEQPFLLPADGPWTEVRDANATALSIYFRHYSKRQYRDGRRQTHFVGQGQKVVLLTACARGLFVWRKAMVATLDGQVGVNCTIFRNEGAGRSSELIRAADAIADRRWPGERHYTYVNARRIRSTNPGYCFLMAGWRRCGITKDKKLVILERPA